MREWREELRFCLATMKSLLRAGCSDLGKTPLRKQLGEAQHRIRAWNAGAMPTQGDLGIHCAIQMAQLFLENSDDVARPAHASRTSFIPDTLARVMLTENSTPRSVITMTCQLMSRFQAQGQKISNASSP